MLRYVFRIHRRIAPGQDDLEDWLQFIHLAAHRVEAIAGANGMEDWVITARRRKWEFAGATARQTDGRWSHKLMTWRPFHGHGRSQGRPKTRWTDSLDHFAAGDWMTLAKDEDQWNVWGDAYVAHHFPRTLHVQ